MHVWYLWFCCALCHNVYHCTCPILHLKSQPSSCWICLPCVQDIRVFNSPICPKHSSHYSVTPKVLPNYRMANDLPNFGNRSTEKTLILSLLSPPFFSFPVSCLFYRDSTSLGLSSLEQWYFISTTIRMVLRHYLCHNTPRFIHET